MQILNINGTTVIIKDQTIYLASGYIEEADIEQMQCIMSCADTVVYEDDVYIEVAWYQNFYSGHEEKVKLNNVVADIRRQLNRDNLKKNHKNNCDN